MQILSRAVQIAFAFNLILLVHATADERARCEEDKKSKNPRVICGDGRVFEFKKTYYRQDAAPRCSFGPANESVAQRMRRLQVQDLLAVADGGDTSCFMASQIKESSIEPEPEIEIEIESESENETVNSTADTKKKAKQKNKSKKAVATQAKQNDDDGEADEGAIKVRISSARVIPEGKKKGRYYWRATRACHGVPENFEGGFKFRLGFPFSNGTNHRWWKPKKAIPHELVFKNAKSTTYHGAIREAEKLLTTDYQGRIDTICEPETYPASHYITDKRCISAAYRPHITQVLVTQTSDSGNVEYHNILCGIGDLAPGIKPCKLLKPKCAGDAATDEATASGVDAR